MRSNWEDTRPTCSECEPSVLSILADARLFGLFGSGNRAARVLGPHSDAKQETEIPDKIDSIKYIKCELLTGKHST
jgi:hypothetical protein